MKTYELLDTYEENHLDKYKNNHPEEFFVTTESLAKFLLELRYKEDEIVQLLSNPTTKACVEINFRAYVIKNKPEKKRFSK